MFKPGRRFFLILFLCLHWLIWSSDVCLCSLSLVVRPHSLISVGGCWALTGFIRHTMGSARGSGGFVTSLPLFSLYAVVVTLWSVFILKAALCLFAVQWAQQRSFAWLSKFTMNPVTHWLIVVCSLVAWKGNNAPFQPCGSALLILWLNGSEGWQWGPVWRWTGPNCGREAWAEERAERDLFRIACPYTWNLHS